MANTHTYICNYMYTYVYCELVTGPGFLHLQAADRGKVFWFSIAAIHRPRCIGRSVHTPISEPQRRQPMALTPTALPPTPGPLPEPSWCLAEERCVEPESWCGSKLENHSIYIYVCIYIYIAMELLYYIRMDRLAMNSHGDNPGCTAILLRLGLRRELPFRLWWQFRNIGSEIV